MTTEQLKDLIEAGNLHHATYRNMGTVWEGLYIYRRDAGGRGFELAGAFNKSMNPRELEAAEEVLRSIRVGVNVGYLGNG